MNLKEHINIVEARQVLDQLKLYAEGKIASRDNSIEVAHLSEMNLASQPVIESDHLGEESVLQPIINDETMVKSAGADTQGENMMLSSVSESPAISSGTQLVSSDSTAKIEENSTTKIQENSVQGAKDYQPSSMATEMPATSLSNQGVLTSQIGDDSVNLSQETETLNQGIEALKTKEYDASTPSIENTLINQSPVSGSFTSTVQNSIEQNIKQIPEQGGTLDYNQPATISGVAETSLIEGSASKVQSEKASTEFNTDGQIAEMVTIPEISIPETGIPSNTESYQATSSGSQAYIADVTPSESDVNVTMPTGLTPDVANDQTLVVGPESFTQSR